MRQSDTRPCYQDPTASSTARAEDLLQRMTLRQKIGQLQCIMSGEVQKDFPDGVGAASMIMHGMTEKEVAEISRTLQEQIMAQTPFRIPALMHVEALSGGIFPGATCYPTPIAQASTWQPELVERMSGTIHRQMRAVGLRQAFAPVMDVSREPRWGRQGETYGEDPTLCAAMSVAYVRGLQSDGDVISTGKHFLGYSNPEGGLNASTTNITPRRLREIYAKPFQAAITEAGMKGAMNSYAIIDAEPVSNSEKILTGLLRNELGFKGFVISDYESVSHPLTRYHTARNLKECGIRALTAGLDLEAPAPKGFSTDGLLDAVESGQLDPAYIDRACRRILQMKFSIGLFERPFPDQDEMKRQYHLPQYEQDSLEIAKKSLVLLKNDGTLPLPKTIRKIALIGPHVDNCRAMFGCYSWGAMVEMISNMSANGDNESGMAGVDSNAIMDKSADFDGMTEMMGKFSKFPGSKVAKEGVGVEALVRRQYPGMRSLLEELRQQLPETQIVFVHGFDYTGTDTSGFEEAYAAAKTADVVLVSCGGKYGWGPGITMGECADTSSINLPGVQEQFFKGLAELHIPYIALHFDGRPVSSDELDRSASAILECWSPARHGAEAITATLFGENNPAGRLPVTVARSSSQLPVYYAHDNGTSYDSTMDFNFKGYTDGSNSPRYFFGYGLSYTSFAYANLQIKTDGDSVTIRADITNTGARSGDETVQFYVADRCASMTRPVMELAGFRRITLQPGEKKTVVMTSRFSQFAFLDKSMHWITEAGSMDVMIGAACNDIRLRGHFEIPHTINVDAAARGFYAVSREE